MSKDVNEKVSRELTLLAALDRVSAEVDTSEIAEIEDWSGAVRGKFYGASVEKPSRLSKLKTGLLSALNRPKTVDVPAPSSGGFSGAVPAASGNVVGHGNLQYSQMAIPELIAVCTSESSEHAWSEFVRRTQPFIKTVITRAVRRSGNVSHQLVDDLIQDVYLKLYVDKLRALRIVEILQESSFFGFLKVVAANTVQDYFRRAYASKRGAAHELEAPTEAPIEALTRDTSPELHREILVTEIDRTLKTLSHEPNFERNRTIFWLYFRQGLSAREIADLPDIKLSVRGVENTLARLTRRIRTALAQEIEKPNRGL